MYVAKPIERKKRNLFYFYSVLIFLIDFLKIEPYLGITVWFLHI